MPNRNTHKIYVADSYYHVYNRGVNGRKIFVDKSDYSVFLNMFKRYLDKEQHKDGLGRPYEWLRGRIELIAFCLMPNHFHLLIYVYDDKSMTRLMQGVASAYTTYFNKKYNRAGPLFQSRYKASMILNDAYLTHISRYIHLNPVRWQTWQHSSLPYYLGKKSAVWVQPERIKKLFIGEDYLLFLQDYEEHKQMLEEVRGELAEY